MGNYRFRLSDMIPNAWFYKLKYVTKTKTQTTTNRKHHHPTTTPAPPPPPPLPSKHHHSQQPRKSYHLTREKFTHNSTTESTTHCPDPPRKSSKNRRTTRRTTRSSPRLVTTTVSASCSCRTTLNSVWTKPDSTPEEYPNSPLDTSSEKESLLPELGPDNAVFISSTCPCKFEKDTTTDFDKNSIPSKLENLSCFDLISESNILPPIITKAKEPANSAKYEERKEYESFITKEQRACSVRRFSVSSPAGVKLRTNSPRMKIQGYGRRSVSSGSRRSISESVAVVKRSEDPQKDFKESMVEMIMENNIRTSKDLEDLLACYLSLNSDEYHELIIKVFKQIWFDVTDVRLK